MAQLERVINLDARRPWEKVTRWKAYQIADAYKITYPPNAPLTVMVKIMEAQGIDPTAPLPDGSVNEWETIYGVDEKGNTTMNRVPKKVPHASEFLSIDHDSIIEKIVKEKQSESDVDTKIADAVKPLSEKVDKLADMFAEFMNRRPGRKPKDAA